MGLSQLSHILPMSLMLEFTHMHFGDMDSHLPYLLLLLLRKMPLLLRLRPERSVRQRLNLRLTPTIYTTILSPTLILSSTLLSRQHQLSAIHLTLLSTILTHMDTLAMDSHTLTIHMLLLNQLRLLKNPLLSLREKGVKLKLILQFLPLTPRSTTPCLLCELSFQLTPMESTQHTHLPELVFMPPDMDIHWFTENN